MRRRCSMSGWSGLRGRLTPFVKLGRTIRKHAEGILAYLDTKMTNGPVEGINNNAGGSRELRVIARRAYGFHSPGALISMLFLCCGGIELAPPARSVLRRRHYIGTVGVFAATEVVVFNAAAGSSWSGLSRTSTRPGGCGGCGCAATRMCASGCSSRRPVATSDSCCAG